VDIPSEILNGLKLDHWQSPPNQALLTPLRQSDESQPAGYFIAGLNPHRALDDEYRGFLQLLTAQLAAAIARADEYESERKRAEALAEIDRAKTAFFSNVSHEFRAPLTLMLGPLEDALAIAESPEQRERLDLANRNALRLLRLVNALLDFSRIEAGRVQVSYRPTDLSTLTAELASSFRSATDRAGLTLNVDTPPLSQPVYVDRDMWETIVLNLLSNAFKFTHEGGITVELREATGFAVLTVHDTGTGIPETEMPKLFDRFHRVDGAKGRSIEGSGIGLALVRELVLRHGGEIAVESELGRGPAFTVTLPLGTAHLPPDRIAFDGADTPKAVRAQAFVEEALRWLPGDGALNAVLDIPVPTPSRRSDAGVRRHVLLVDDNADLRNYIVRLLTEQGYDVDTASDGEAALASLRISRPDLIITDVMMPRLDGFGLLRAVRENPKLYDLPVIMLSARAGEEATVEGLDAGADDYLTKPFSARELLARVSANIAMARVRREAAQSVRASEARFRGVFESGAIGFSIFDANTGETLAINDRLLAMTGHTRLDFKEGGWDWREFTPPEYLHLDTNAVEQARAQGSWVAFEKEYRRKDGKRIPVRVSSAPLPGEPGRVVVVVDDLTQIKAAERKLKELNQDLERRVMEALAEKRLLAEIIDRADVFVQVADRNFTWLAINKAAASEFAQIFGVPEPKTGDNMLAALDAKPEHRAAIEAVWSRALNGEEFI
jgi:PAS domain S-box-containing protein